VKNTKKSFVQSLFEKIVDYLNKSSYNINILKGKLSCFIKMRMVILLFPFSFFYDFMEFGTF